jgi:hypothetical protein
VRNTFSLNACVDAYAHLYDLMLEQPALSANEIARRYRAGRGPVSFGPDGDYSSDQDGTGSRMPRMTGVGQ